MPLSDRLVEILARMVESAIEVDQRLVSWAIESGATLAEPCNCRATSGDQACACNAEPPARRAFMVRAAERLRRGEFVGIPPEP